MNITNKDPGSERCSVFSGNTGELAEIRSESRNKPDLIRSDHDLDDESSENAANHVVQTGNRLKANHMTSGDIY